MWWLKELFVGHDDSMMTLFELLSSASVEITGYQRKAGQLFWWIRRLRSLIHPTIFGYQRKFVGWIKRSESTENCKFNQP